MSGNCTSSAHRMRAAINHARPFALYAPALVIFGLLGYMVYPSIWQGGPKTEAEEKAEAQVSDAKG